MNISIEESRCPECCTEAFPTVIADPYKDTYIEHNICVDCDAKWLVVGHDHRLQREHMMHFRPMSANTFHRERAKHMALIDEGRASIEEKLNGDRCLSFSWLNGTQFFTRTLAKADGLPTEKTEHLPHLNWLNFRAPTILDGEIVVIGRSDHSKVGSIFGCAPAKCIERQRERGWLIYVIFDCLMYDGEDVREKSLDERIGYREDIYSRIVQQFKDRKRGKSGVRVPCPQVRLVRTGTTLAFVQELLDNGYEGGVVKDLTKPYVSGGRPANNWMKDKEEVEVDLVIMGYKDANSVSTKSDGTVSKTKFAGQIGSVDLGAYHDGDLVKICNASGMTDAFRKRLTLDQSLYLNKVVRVKGQRVTKNQKGEISVQNPRIRGNTFRKDKEATECQYEHLVDMVIE